jgi:hypothetical protein
VSASLLVDPRAVAMPSSVHTFVHRVCMCCVTVDVDVGTDGHCTGSDPFVQVRGVFRGPAGQAGAPRSVLGKLTARSREHRRR